MISLISRLLYRVAELFDAFVIFSDKFNKSLSFRRQWRNSIDPNFKGPALWIHGASVGELEDLAGFFTDIERVKNSGFTNAQLVLTSSSVSASEKLRKLQAQLGCAYAGPIPPERPQECAEFLKLLRPKVLLLSHSDTWPCLTESLQEYHDCAVLWFPEKVRELSFLKKKCLLPVVHHIALRSREERFPTVTPQSFIGNPRVDRIYQRIQKQTQSEDPHVLKTHKANPQPDKLSILIGSGWREDAQFASKVLQQLEPELQRMLQIVVIPHEPNDSHQCALIKNALPHAQLVLAQGILLEAYQDFDLAWVGGGFKSGLHSILEPALWGIPVLCGPDLKKQSEANSLKKNGQLYSYSNPQDLASLLRNLMLDSAFRAQIKARCLTSSQTLQEHLGASDRISELIKNCSPRNSKH